MTGLRNLVLSLFQLIQVISFSFHDHLVNCRNAIGFRSELESFEVQLAIYFLEVDVLGLVAKLALERIRLVFLLSNYLLHLRVNFDNSESHVVPELWVAFQRV